MFQEAIDSYPITPAEISVPISTPTEFAVPKFLRMLLLAISVLVLSVVFVGLLLYGVVGFFSMMTHGVSHYASMVTGVGIP